MSKFSMPGNVHPTEYDWKKQFTSCAKICSKTGEVERIFDVGKVLGLAEYAEELEIKLSAAEKEIENLKSSGIHTCHDKCQNRVCLLKRENDSLKSKLALAVEALNHLRRDSNLWKTAGRGGCDKYQGMPPGMRFIDKALKAINGGE